MFKDFQLNDFLLINFKKKGRVWVGRWLGGKTDYYANMRTWFPITSTHTHIQPSVTGHALQSQGLWGESRDSGSENSEARQLSLNGQIVTQWETLPQGNKVKSNSRSHWMAYPHGSTMHIHTPHKLPRKSMYLLTLLANQTHSLNTVPLPLKSRGKCWIAYSTPSTGAPMWLQHLNKPWPPPLLSPQSLHPWLASTLLENPCVEWCQGVCLLSPEPGSHCPHTVERPALSLFPTDDRGLCLRMSVW